MKEIFIRTGKAWSTCWQNKYFRWQFILSILFFIGATHYNFHYLNIFEHRTGIHLDDFILNMLPPTDFSNIIFFFTYFALITSMVSAIPYPGIYVRGLQAYGLILLLRVVSIYFFPLEPPKNMILLIDPVAEFFLYEGAPITKDLFFSGHAATLMMFFLIARNKYVKIFCLTALIVAPILLMWQHVHYSIDIFVGLFVGFACLKLTDWVNSKSPYGKILFEY